MKEIDFDKQGQDLMLFSRKKDFENMSRKSLVLSLKFGKYMVK